MAIVTYSLHQHTVLLGFIPSISPYFIGTTPVGTMPKRNKLTRLVLVKSRVSWSFKSQISSTVSFFFFILPEDKALVAYKVVA